MSRPGWFGNRNKKISVKKKSMIREKAFAKSVGMKTTPGSGSFSKHLADVYGDNLRIEHKMTDKKSISVKLDWVEKIIMEAAVKGEIPVICLEIQGKRLFLVDEMQFKLLMELNRDEGDI